MKKDNNRSTHKLNSIIRGVDQQGYSKSGEFKRPNHPDFMVASELKAMDFSGVRKNEVGLVYEFWIAGEIKRTASFEAVNLDNTLMPRIHLELFGLVPEKTAGYDTGKAKE